MRIKLFLKHEKAALRSALSIIKRNDEPSEISRNLKCGRRRACEVLKLSKENFVINKRLLLIIDVI